MLIQKNAIISFWIRRNGGAGSKQTILNNLNGLLETYIGTDNKIHLEATGGGSKRCDINTTATILVDGSWHHVMMSFNGTSQHVYVDGVSSKTSTTNVDATIDWTMDNWYMGASQTPSNYLNADVADLIFDNTYLDLSQSSNRALFINTDGDPVDPGSDGSTAIVAGSPLIVFNKALASWHTNAGTGEGFTEVGALTAGSTVRSAFANDFTNNNTVTTTTHTPTNIFGLANPLVKSAITYSNGNKTVVTTTSANSRAMSTLPIIGKMKIEVTINSGSTVIVGLQSLTQGTAIEAYYYGSTGAVGGVTGSAGATFGASDVITMLVDDDAGTIEFKKNNTSQGGARTINASGYTAGEGSMCFEYGDGTTSNAVNVTIAVESGDWDYSDTATFLECSTESIASATTRTASDTTKYFDTILYEGNGDGQRVGQFQPFGNAFTVAKSALFNGTNYLARTPSSTGSTTIATFSRWVKRTTPGNQDSLFAAYVSSTQLFQIYFPTDNTLHVYNYSSGYDWQVATNRVFEDPSQWFHVYIAIDTTESTSSDRVKIYINGVQETSLGTASYPSSSFANDFNTSSVVNNLGPYNGATGSGGLEGYTSETAWVDGTIYAPSYFGQTDTSTNRWIPKALAGITWGTNGFYQDYADSDNVGDDESGNGNDFSNNGTVAQTTDSPTTNLAVLNPIPTVSQTLSVGNTRATGAASSAWRSRRATISAPSGKFYAEWECQSNFTGAGGGTAIASVVDDNSSIYPGVDTNSVGVYSSTAGDVYVGLAGATDVDTGLNTAADDRILACFDVESGKAWAGFYDANTTTTYWYKNTGATGADPAAGTFPTYAFPPNTPLTFMTTTYNTQVIDFFAESSNFTLTPPTGFSALTQDNMTSFRSIYICI